VPLLTAHSIPTSLDSFVGRVEELAEIDRLVQRGRLVTLVGPAGAGKTRLAWEIADRIKPRYPGGIFALELCSLTEEFLVQAVADLFRVPQQHDAELMDLIARGLPNEPALLIIDTCEHLIDACSDMIYDLLRRCPSLSVLATSRELLRLPGERIFTCDGLASGEAVELFTERASERQSAWTLDRAHYEIVESICSRLDNLPLGIELAARWARAVPLGEVVSTISEQRSYPELVRLRGGDPRHRDLDTAIEWSYALISGAERQFLNRMAVLPGGFDCDLALAMCSDLGLSKSGCVELLSMLEAKSLVVARQLPMGRIRFHQLNTVQRYAERRLTESSDRDAAVNHLVEQMALIATPLVQHPFTRTLAQQRLCTEHRNLVQTVDCLADTNDSRRLLLNVAVSRSDPSRANAAAVRDGLGAAIDVEDAPPEYRCLALSEAAWIAVRLGDGRRGVPFAQRAVSVAREQCRLPMICRAQWVLGHVYLSVDKFADAEASLKAAVQSAMQARDKTAEIACLNGLAWACMSAGELGSAERALQKALAVGPIGDDEAPSLARSLNLAGVLALYQSLNERAEQGFLAALRIQERHGQEPAPLCLEGLAILAQNDGQPDRCLRLVGAANMVHDRRWAFRNPWWITGLTKAVALAEERMQPTRAAKLRHAGFRLTPSHALQYALRSTAEPAASGPPSMPTLTYRESSVAQMITQGLTNRSIGSRLGISERTVQTHFQTLRTKLGVRSRTELAAWIARNNVDFSSARPGRTAGLTVPARNVQAYS
jgi:predicted ATPase/DNA-binding CsgD family transcriptional regulator